MKSEKEIQAIIPAAGAGTRLRPLTHSKPKALVSVGGKPIISHIIDTLLPYGINDIIVIIGYFGEKIKEQLPRMYSNVKFTFIEQKERLGLAHAISLAKPYVSKPVLIVYGDTLFEGDISTALKSEADGALGTKIVDDPRRFGVIEKKGRFIKKLIEKPSFVKRSEVLVGVNFIRDFEKMFKAINYIIEKNITLKGEYQLTDAFQKMVEWRAKLISFNIEKWFDCGTLESLLETNQHILKKHSKLRNPVVMKDNIILPPVYISKKAQVRQSIIGPYVSIADGAKISNSIVKNTIINSGASVKGLNIANSIIGDNSTLEASPFKISIGDDSEFFLNKLENEQKQL